MLSVEWNALQGSIGVVRVSCSRCGRYDIEDAIIELKGRAQDRYILSGITRRGSDQGSLVRISSENMDVLLDSEAPPRDPQGVLDRVILYVGGKATTFVTGVEVFQEYDYPLALARNTEELAYCMQIGKDSGLIKTDGNEIRLTAKGWHRFNQLRHTQKDSSQASVAMSFDASLDPIWTDGLKPALEHTGYHPLRIDQKEFNDKIDDQIIAEIRRSGLLVADVTGHSGGVYFEAVLALGLGIEVIWTCREGEIEMAHFDTRQYKHIVWRDAEDLRTQLINRIEATGLAQDARASIPRLAGGPP